MPYGQKHLVKCRCVLPQFKQANNPPAHQFTVFSVVNDDDTVKQKYAQCPNCGVIHKVIDVWKSEIIQSKESMSSIVTITDIKPSLPENLVKILESNNADLPSWESAQFIIENQRWGEFVVLNTETEEGVKHVKYVRILGSNMFKVESLDRQETV